MSTKSHILTFNNKQIVANNSSPNVQYSNLNLNQNIQYFKLPSVSSNYVPKQSNKNHLQQHSGTNNDDHNSWNTPISQSWLASPAKCPKKDTKKENGAKTSNNSTLSLHIAAYENSIDATSESSDGPGMKQNMKKFEKMKYFYEFPRSNESTNDATTELQQFKASQKLMNPNEQQKKSRSKVGNVKAAKPAKAVKAVKQTDKYFKMEYDANIFKVSDNGKLWSPLRSPDAETVKVIAEKSKQVESMIKSGRYISSGGFGSISLCKINGSNKDFILKKIKPNGITDLKAIDAELNVYSRIDSPYIPRFFYGGILQSCYCLVTSYVDGGTLDDLIENKNASLAIKDVKFFGYEMALGLECLHEHNISHCDLKENNVALTSDGHIKLLDFGLSRNVATPQILPRTVYSAPEVRFEKPAGTAADIWALAQILSNVTQKKVKAKASFDPDASDFYASCQKLKPEDRLKKPSEHPFLKHVKAKPSYKPGKFQLHAQQPNDEIHKAAITFNLRMDQIKSIYDLGLLRFPSYKTFKSLK